jgi:hypothetical protein
VHQQLVNITIATEMVSAQEKSSIAWMTVVFWIALASKHAPMRLWNVTLTADTIAKVMTVARI